MNDFAEYGDPIAEQIDAHLAAREGERIFSDALSEGMDLHQIPNEVRGQLWQDAALELQRRSDAGEEISVETIRDLPHQLRARAAAFLGLPEPPRAAQPRSVPTMPSGEPNRTFDDIVTSLGGRMNKATKWRPR